MFAPAQLDPAGTSGILAYSWVASDDGQLAIVEFVARDRAAFRGILAANRAEVKAFLKGKHKKDDVERELKRHKRDFDAEQMGVVLP